MDEEDVLDAYMKTLEVPADFAAAQNKQDFGTEEESDKVITLEDLLKMQQENKEEAEKQSENGGDDDKFFQALLTGDGAINGKDQSESSKNELTSAEPTSSEPQQQSSQKTTTEVYMDDGIGGDLDDNDNIETNGLASAMEIIAAKAKKKEIKPVDHSKIQYPPFRKNFYVESPDVAAMTDEQLAELKEELEITIRGRNPPRPISKWEECGITAKMLETLLANGWAKPFAIQRQAVPAIMSGRDVMGIAQTGSGKTLAYLVPMLRHIKDQPPVIQGHGPIALIIAPTRELATQIQKEVNKFKKSLGVDCTCLYGGQNVGDQIRELKKGVPVVVGTPGRLIDILSAQSGRNLPLNRVTFVVLDEADRLFDMGFTPQVERILKNVRPDRQTVMFSATFPPHVEKLAKEALNNPLHIVIGNARSGAKVSSDVTQIVELWNEDKKFLRLLQLLGEWYTKGNILIFCDSQVNVDSLYQGLEKAGYPAVTLHAGKDQLDRDYAIKDFKNKVRTVMVATGVAGRGLDVPDLNLVVNYNCPNHLEEYVHRVGRTGRAGKKGVAVTFVSDPEDAKYASDLIFALKASEQTVPDFLKRMADEFAAKVAAGTEKKHQSGYKTKGFAFEEGVDSGGYTGQVKKMRSALYEEIRASEKDENANLDGEADLDGDANTGVEPPPVPSPSPPPATSAPVSAPPPSHVTTTANAPAPPAYANNATPPNVDPRIAEVNRIKAEEIAKAKALAPAATAAGGGGAAGATHGMPSRGFGSQPNPPPQQQRQFQSRPQHGLQEIDMNDLPAIVRQKMMAKRFINNIENDFKVSVTVKGRVIPPGTKVGPGDQKLTMMIESQNPQHVKNAVAELNRFIHHEAKNLTADQAFEHVSGASASRYRL